MPLSYNDKQKLDFNDLVQRFPVMGLLAGNIAEAVDESVLFNSELVQSILLEKLKRFGEYDAEAADSLIATLLDLERMKALSPCDAQQFTSQITALIVRK